MSHIPTTTKQKAGCIKYSTWFAYMLKSNFYVQTDVQDFWCKDSFINVDIEPFVDLNPRINFLPKGK